MTHHYVYYSYEEWGRGYIGVRSCKCLPEEDCEYFGSFYDKTFEPTEKIIIDIFESREQALQAEIDLHAFYQVHVNPHFANKARQTSTRFVSNGEGMQVCIKKYPNFQSEAGKIGGKVTQERHPELASISGKMGYQAGIKKFMENNPNWVEMFAEYRTKGNDYFRNNPEAAKKRGANGIKAMQDYWRQADKPSQKGKKGTKVEVKLPDGEVKHYPSINAAADDLSVPRTTMKRLAKGQLVRRYADYEVTPSQSCYNKPDLNQQQ